ncbi:MAG: gamma carbonic anhydrase family protein [Firmicutes bacterium]|nr:gamma carbonic anhydrase family protein [Bacillota bacterium]
MIIRWLNHHPKIDPTAFIAEGAKVIGGVTMEEHSSLWFNSVARGDVNHISIGKYSNIQDSSTLHVADDYPLIIGNYVTAGHNVKLHGCTIKDRVLVGIGAIVLNGAQVNDDIIIGAGALVTEGAVLAILLLYLGIPCKPVRKLTPEEIATNKMWAEKYALLSRSYMEGYAPADRKWGL